MVGVAITILLGQEAHSHHATRPRRWIEAEVEFGEDDDVVFVAVDSTVEGPAAGDEPESGVVNVAVDRRRRKGVLVMLFHPRDTEHGRAAVLTNHFHRVALAIHVRAPSRATSVRFPIVIVSGPALASPTPPTTSCTMGAARSTPTERPDPTDLPSLLDEPSPRVTLPVAIEIPDIDVRSALVALGVDDDRRLEVPADADQAGWYAGGPRPGEEGAAVVVGHFDWTDGPAVFWRLNQLQTGDPVHVTGLDGTTTDFIVDRVERWPKAEFPTDLVYQDADGAELRLITCGGSFNDEVGSYRDNVIVFARLATAT